MARRQRRRRQPVERGQTSREVLHPNAAGIDVGAEFSYVAVPEGRAEQTVRRFACFTADLQALADWLQACGVDTVAMESTGVYWIPLFQVLESRGFEVFLVNARHVKNVPGRKTDVQDCQWLQQLHSFGLLAASFRPEDEICVLRSYWRHRDTLVRYAASHVQHMHKALEQMNVQLHKVISDVTGVTGLRILEAILAGERDPKQLVGLKDGRIRSSADTIAKALEGDWRDEHLFALRQALDGYRFYQQQIGACDQEVEAYLNTLETRAEGPPPWPQDGRPRKPKGNTPSFDLRSHLYRITGADFPQIDGLDVLTAQTIISEVGLDPSRFGTAKRFCSWLGTCPDNRVTGGKVKSTHTRPVANRAAKAFRLAARSAGKTQSPIGAFYRRIKARKGAPEAITATAHKIARIFFHLWQHPQAFDPTHLERHQQQYEQRRLNNLRRAAKERGFQLVPLAAAAG